MFALARLALWDALEHGVDSTLAARLAMLLDRTILVLAEGQYLDISSEDRQTIPVAMYVDMIERKTAALMSCATEMGARLGTTNTETINCLRSFGKAIGIAFQIRDDLLGIWATREELGKTEAGDIYRCKKSLPILHALEHATPRDRNRLQEIYQQKTLSPGVELKVCGCLRKSGCWLLKISGPVIGTRGRAFGGGRDATEDAHVALSRGHVVVDQPP